MTLLEAACGAIIREEAMMGRPENEVAFQSLLKIQNLEVGQSGGSLPECWWRMPDTRGIGAQTCELRLERGSAS